MKFDQVIEKLKNPLVCARLPEWGTKVWIWFPLLDSVVEVKEGLVQREIPIWRDSIISDILRDDWEITDWEVHGPGVFSFSVAAALLENGYKVKRGIWSDILFLEKGTSAEGKISYLSFKGSVVEQYILSPDDIKAVDWRHVRE